MKTEILGSVIRTRLNNGLTVVLKETHNAPVVAIQVWVEVGSADEQPGEEGLAHLHEHMLFKGTTTRGVGDIAQAIESAGGDINAWTSLDHTVYHLVVASRFEKLGIEVLADVIQNASFDPEELEREKSVILEEVKRNRDLPSRWIGDNLFSVAYRSHPYRRAILGTEKSIVSVNRAVVQKFFKAHYVPNRITVVIVGDIQWKATLQLVQKLFGAMPAQSAKLLPRSSEPVQRKLRVSLSRQEIKEVYFDFGWHVPSAEQPDIPALDILSIILGQGESSRLNLGLKRELGLVNDVYAYSYSPKDPGLFVVGGTCPVDQALAALSQIAREMSRLSNQPITANELAKAKTIIENEMLYNQETAQGVARRLGYYQTTMGDPNYFETYLSRLQAVTAEEVLRVAKSYLTATNCSAIVLLPRRAPKGINQESVQKSILEGFAPVLGIVDNTPRVSRMKIKNGPTLIIEEDHLNPLVSIRAVFLGGVRYETDENNGINSFLSEMITRGTTSRSAEDIAREIDASGGALEGFSGRNTFGLRAEFPSSFLDRGMALVADCLLNPSFPAKEMQRERELILEEIRSREDNLSGLTFDLFSATLYKSHPYRLPLQGTRQSIINLRREHLISYWEQYYTPERMVISVAGDVDPKQIEARIREKFSGSQLRPKVKLPVIPLEPKPEKIRTRRKFLNRNQAHLVIGFLGTTLSSRDRFCLEVLMAVLTGQGGRIYVELRERMSLAYTVSGFSLEGIEPGYVAIYMAVDPSRVDEAVGAVKDQLQRLKQEPITQQEIERAQRYLIGVQAISLQRISSRATSLAFHELYGLGYLSYQQYPENILSVTTEDLQLMVRKYFDLKSYVLTMVRPRS